MRINLIKLKVIKPDGSFRVTVGGVNPNPQRLSVCLSVCLSATLRVIPNKSQFFQYERVSLRCDRWGNSSGWRVMRNTSLHKNQPCLNLRPGGEGSFFLTLYQSDSGVYWCQSAAGQCSHAVLITVTGGFELSSSLALAACPPSLNALWCP